MKTFPTQMKNSKCPTKEKMWQERQKMREGDKVKGLGQHCCVTFKPNLFLEILLFLLSCLNFES